MEHPPLQQHEQIPLIPDSISHAAARRIDFLAAPGNPLVTKMMLALNVVLAIVYFCSLAFFFKIGNFFLFDLLIFGEVFHLWQVLTFIYSVWDTSYQAPRFENHTPSVDVFITVAGEPVEIVEETVKAAVAMHYPNFTVNILNDSYVAKKDNWKEYEVLAKKYKVNCITRTIPGGAKAGNINNGIAETTGELFVVFDADHVPYPTFLAKTVPYFGDPKVAFVQTPQFYKNYGDNHVTLSSWEQQELFFGPICKGRNRHNAAQMCGTNMVLSRKATLEVGGMCTESIAEDFLTGMLMHERGYKSVYIPEVLAEGLATEELLTYSKQQFRWARGALDVLFKYNPLTRKGLTWPQKIEYLSGASFFVSGVIVVLDAMLSVVFFFTGLIPLAISGMLLASIFLPYLFVTLYNLQRSTNFTFTYRSMAFSVGAFSIQIAALWAAITGQKNSFVITEKRRVAGNYLPLVRVHFVYIGLVLAGAALAFYRFGLTASLVNNFAWGVINIALFWPFVQAALPQKERATSEPTDIQGIPTVPATSVAF
jgi:cellulose synthase (UDP-forming)